MTNLGYIQTKHVNKSAEIKINIFVTSLCNSRLRFESKSPTNLPLPS